jgi:hypothetical protein
VRRWNVHVEGDALIPQVLHPEGGSDDILSGLVKNEDLPGGELGRLLRLLLGGVGGGGGRGVVEGEEGLEG